MNVQGRRESNKLSTRRGKGESIPAFVAAQLIAFWIMG
jgi:hypothetical protein